MNAIFLRSSVLIVFAAAALAEAADKTPRALTKGEAKFLDSLLSLRIGMKEEGFYKVFPEAGVLVRKPELLPSSYLGDHLEFPDVTISGLTLLGRAKFYPDLDEVRLWTHLWSRYPGPHYLGEKEDGPIVSRDVMRKIYQLISAHIERRLGNAEEQFVPEAPDEGSFWKNSGLRRTWRFKGTTVIVEFFQNARNPTSGIEVRITDWPSWEWEQKAKLQAAWPLKRATASQIRKVSGSNDVRVGNAGNPK